MNFNCPYCGKACDFEEMQMDADLLAIIKMQPIFGKNAHLVWAYCELFGITPLKTRRKKLRLLLEEMTALIQAEEFVYQKRRYRISQAGIAEALNVMVHKHWDAHLENHNYLKKIMISVAEASAKKDGLEAEKDLRKREDRLRAGDRYPVPEEQIEPPPVRHSAHPYRHSVADRNPFDDDAATLTPEQREKNLRRLGDIIKKIGG